MEGGPTVEKLVLSDARGGREGGVVREPFTTFTRHLVEMVMQLIIRYIIRVFTG